MSSAVKFEQRAISPTMSVRQYMPTKTAGFASLNARAAARVPSSIVGEPAAVLHCAAVVIILPIKKRGKKGGKKKGGKWRWGKGRSNPWATAHLRRHRKQEKETGEHGAEGAGGGGHGRARNHNRNRNRGT